MFALSAAASYAARASGHHVYVTGGGGFPFWGIVLIVIAVILLLALGLTRPYGRYRSRRYVETGPPMGGVGGPAGGRAVVEEEDIV